MKTGRRTINSHRNDQHQGESNSNKPIRCWGKLCMCGREQLRPRFWATKFDWLRLFPFGLSYICTVLRTATVNISFPAITVMPAKYERLPTSPDSYSPDSYSPPSTRSPSPSEITFPPPRSASRMAREAERTRELQRQTERDPRFNVPPPSTWKRVALLLFVGLLFWLSFYVKLSKPEKPKVIHANRYVLFFLSLIRYSILLPFHPLVVLLHLLSALSYCVSSVWHVADKFFLFWLECRYSKEYKFRPAASPIITERLKDGRVRLRGAQHHHGLWWLA